MRITRKDREEYNKMVRNTKNKVRSTVKKYGALIHDVKNMGNDREVVSYDIREKLNLPSIESFKNRKEFTDFMNEQKKFTSGRSPHAKFFKNEHGAVMTSHLKTVFENKHQKAEKLRLKEVALLEKAGVGEVARVESMMMAKPTNTFFNKIKLDFSSFWNKGDLERKLAGLVVKGSPEDIAEKKARLKQNFITALNFAFNSDVDDLVDMIDKIPDDEFYVLYELNKEHMDIRYIPSPQKAYLADYVDKGALDRSLGKIYMIIGQYIEDKGGLEAEMLMKDF